jgi:anthranilate phosphoribosyltransferase
LRNAAGSATVARLMLDHVTHLQTGRELSPGQIEEAVAALLDPQREDSAKADFLKALRQKGETAGELAGFAQCLLKRAVDPQLDPARLPGPVLDVCGTGGDQMDLFNVSTTSMFVLAAGGAAVVKHGNRAITSQCGGADVLEALGVRIDLPPEKLRTAVETLGVGFVFAPHYHPAFKAVAPVRKTLAAQGIPTIFNMLGPLLNPARPAYQMVGLFSGALLEKYGQTLAHLGRERAWALHGNGTDELANTGPSDVLEVTQKTLRRFAIDPAQLGLPLAAPAQLRGGDRTENARILTGILSGTEPGPKTDIVLLNAAAGFVITGLAPDLAAGLDRAREQITSRRALAKLQALQDFSA